MDLEKHILFSSFSCGDPSSIISARDVATGAIMMTYKGGTCCNKTLTVVKGEYLIGADNQKPLLFIWALNKRDPILRIQTTGIVCAVDVSPNSSYLVAGVEEKIFIWTIPDGILQITVNHHLSKISCLKFSELSSHFVTGDDHGLIAVWSLPRLLAFNESRSSLEPNSTFNQHSSKITDVKLGFSSTSNRLLVASASLDGTLKVWNSKSGQVLLNLSYNNIPIMTITTDSMMIHMVLSLQDGTLKYINHLRETKDHASSFSTRSVVVCGELTRDGRFISGSTNGDVQIWDLDSKTFIKTMSHKGKCECLKLIDLPGDWYETGRRNRCINIQPMKFYTINPNDSDYGNVTVRLNNHQLPFCDDWSKQMYEKDLNIPEDITTLKDQLLAANRKNSELYNFAVTRLLQEDKRE